MGNWKYIRLSYLIPGLCVVTPYLLIWLFGFNSLATKEMILDWAKKLGVVGIGTLNMIFVVIMAVIILGTTSVIRSMATTLTEEIGW